MSLRLEWMTPAGELALIKHEDGGLFRYRYGGPKGVTCTYERVDDPEQAFYQAEKHDWVRIDKEFPLMGDLNEFVTHYLTARAVADDAGTAR